MDGQLPSRMTRIRGGVLIALGSALVIGLSMIRTALAPDLSAPGIGPDGSGFTGTAEQGSQILWLLNVVLALSAAFVVNGIYMLATGRMNRMLQGVTAALVVVTAVVLYATKRQLG